MNQHSLFDLEPSNPIAHATDPPTSHEAALAHVVNGKWEMHARLVYGLVLSFPGWTAIELWERAHGGEKRELKEPQEVRRRLTDLLAMGLVRQGPARVCRVRGTRQVTWYAVR